MIKTAQKKSFTAQNPHQNPSNYKVKPLFHKSNCQKFINMKQNSSTILYDSQKQNSQTINYSKLKLIHKEITSQNNLHSKCSKLSDNTYVPSLFYQLNFEIKALIGENKSLNTELTNQENRLEQQQKKQTQITEKYLQFISMKFLKAQEKVQSLLIMQRQKQQKHKQKHLKNMKHIQANAERIIEGKGSFNRMSKNQIKI